jgi:hypothetical protein
MNSKSITLYDHKLYLNCFKNVYKQFKYSIYNIYRMPQHKNHANHHKKWVVNNRSKYNEYMKLKQREKYQWIKISRIFLRILL